jgi:hypothetical protein
MSKMGRAFACPPERAARARAGEKGQALIELAFVLPIMLVLILIILDFGIALDRREVIAHAAREAARAGAAGATTGDIVSVAVDQSDGLLDPTDITLICYQDGPDLNTYPGDARDAVRIAINYDYQTALAGGVLGVSGTVLDISPTVEAMLMTPVPGAGALECPP